MAKIVAATGILLSCILFFLSGTCVAAASQRVVTIVHPIRSRAQWDDIQSFDRQIELMTANTLPATWLLQYSVLSDLSVLSRLHHLPADQELGLFLEVDDRLATAAQAPYIFGEGDWARADKVLLSGYEPAARKRMIDEAFARFKQEFGVYPSSVGAWYIDAVSQQYLFDRYHIVAIMDCADQYVTDGYGLWGKPWGTPFYPSINNGLVPAQSPATRLSLVKIQWAPRDPVLGYGTTVSDSTYSVQANDYPRHGLNGAYFEQLLKTYLFTDDPLTQLTVGIEVGQEGKGFAQEYAEQIAVVRQYRDSGQIQPMTMKAFAQVFQDYYGEKSPSFLVVGSDHHTPKTTAYWYSSDRYRVGVFFQDGILQIRDLRWYDDRAFFPDVFAPDTAYPLRRIIPAVYDRAVAHTSRELFADIRSLTTAREGQSVIFAIKTADGKTHQLLLQPDTIVIDGRSVSPPAKLSPAVSLRRQAIQWLLTVSHWLPHVWYGDIRFATVNGTRYVGVWVAPDRLVGVKSAWPYLGNFRFPFQVVTRFRAVPHADLINRLGMYLVVKQ